MAESPEDAPARFAANVDRLRRQRGYSMDVLAQRSQLAAEDLGAILGGEVEADFESIHRLAGALGAAPGEFFDGIVWIPDGEGRGRFRIGEPPDG